MAVRIVMSCNNRKKIRRMVITMTMLMMIVTVVMLEMKITLMYM